MDHHQSLLSDIPEPLSPTDEHDLPPELRAAHNGTLTLDSDSGIGVIMLHNALRADAPDTPMEWARPILELYTGGLAHPPTYMELLSEHDVAIWARFTFEQEWQKFEFSFAGQPCAVELATTGEVPVSGRRWRDAPLKLEPFVGTIERTLQAAANLAKEHPLPLDLASISSNGYTPDAARPVTFTPWLHPPRVAVDPEAMRAYLQLFEEALESCPEGRLAAFVLPGAITFATRDPDKLVEWAAQQAKQLEVSVYLHTGLHALPEGLGKHRGSIATACAVIGLFADIDAWAPDRKKPRETLCPTPADAIRVVKAFDELYSPIATTLLIASGNGCYPALLFKEPYVITNDEDRVLLDSLGRRFRLALHLIATEWGWTGAVEGCDLAKVLRLPGTLHRKEPKNPKSVGLLYHHPERRYTLLNLDELLPPHPVDRRPFLRTTESRQQSVAGAIVLDSEARPPAEKLELMLQIDILFNRSWHHQRNDLPDQSQSGYDLSLAHGGASAGWSDQEIVDLLIANRREHGGEPKLREDYYRRTIARAREGLAPAPTEEDRAGEEGQGMDEIDSAEGNEPTSTEAGSNRSDRGDGDDGSTTTSNGGGAAGKAKSNKNDASSAGTASGAASGKRVLLQFLSESLGVPIVRVVKYVGEPASYRIDTKNGTVKIPLIANLVVQSKLRHAIAEVTGLWFEPFTRKKWHPIAQMLLQACEMEDLGEDATRRGQMIQWLTGYLKEKTIQPTLEAADEGKEPFHVEDRICIFLGGLKEWLKVRHGERPTDLAAQLKDFGAEHKPSIDVTIKDKKTTRGAWKLPHGPWIP